MGELSSAVKKKRFVASGAGSACDICEASSGNLEFGKILKMPLKIGEYFAFSLYNRFFSVKVF